MGKDVLSTSTSIPRHKESKKEGNVGQQMLSLVEEMNSNYVTSKSEDKLASLMSRLQDAIESASEA